MHVATYKCLADALIGALIQQRHWQQQQQQTHPANLNQAANLLEDKENDELEADTNSSQFSQTGFMLMNKRQLMANLNSLFLGELKSQLIERAQEFTDCAYTKHERRETILLLLQCIKLQLNKLVKLLYRFVSAPSKSLSSKLAVQYTNLRIISASKGISR